MAREWLFAGKFLELRGEQYPPIYVVDYVVLAWMSQVEADCIVNLFHLFGPFSS
jgi:hypothetical protein